MIKYLALFVLLFSFCSNSNIETSKKLNDYYTELGIKSFKDKKPALKLAFLDLDDQPVTLEKYKGKVILLNFWFLDCPFCKKEKPEFEKLKAQMKNKDFIIVSVCIDGESRVDEIPIYIEEKAMTITVLKDPKRESAQKLFQGAVPTSFIINKEGNIIGLVEGDREWASQASIEFFKILAG